MKTSFIPPETSRIKAVVFRSHTVDADLKQRLIGIRDDANYRGLVMNDEVVRVLLNDIYDTMKASAEEELKDMQNRTAGVAIHRAVQAFAVPRGFKGDLSEDAELVERVSKFPFNFGKTLIRKKNNSVHFFCLANEFCREQGTSHELLRHDWESSERRVLDHIRSLHWQQLLQTGYV